MTKQNRLHIFQRVLLLFLVFAELCGASIAQADTGDKYTLDINISGTVVANGSCSLDQDGELNVNFGTVKLENIGNNKVQLDGDYLRPLASSFFCSGDTAGLLQMQFTSASGSYEIFGGKKVLGTSKGIIAIELIVNGVVQSMGEWFNVDQANSQVLQAHLVEISADNNSNVISGDTFTASGTLTLAFN